MEAKDLLDKIATPGDAAAAGIGFAVGLPIDYIVLHMGVPPGIVSGYAAVAAWSIKKSFESILKARRAREEARRSEERTRKEAQDAREVELHAREEHHQRLQERSERLAQYLKEEDREDFLKLHRNKTRLWEAELLEDDAFERSMFEIVALCSGGSALRLRVAQSGGENA